VTWSDFGHFVIPRHFMGRRKIEDPTKKDVERGCWMCGTSRTPLLAVTGTMTQGEFARMPLCIEHVASVLSHPENCVPDRRILCSTLIPKAAVAPQVRQT